MYFSRIVKFKSIVSTEITNPWLKEQLHKNRIKNIVSKVGDRNVFQKVAKYNSLFGFETSGHFGFNYRMDGLYSSIVFMKIISKNINLINKILKQKITYKKKIYGIKMENINQVKKFLNKKKGKLKTIFRKSIWNEYFKLYIYYKEENIKDFNNLNKYLFNKSFKIKIKN